MKITIQAPQGGGKSLIADLLKRNAFGKTSVIIYHEECMWKKVKHKKEFLANNHVIICKVNQSIKGDITFPTLFPNSKVVTKA